ncbi:4'-phosphopantetheinyl transferase superfamily protein [Pseudomonas sp. RIT-PI-S]|uniref:4'-phosphopantetheinyl transferase family protein n=1 Tax=Pseudomonas sp. RIT-PI-S TaxID=3035295 RepID=UPI0021DA7C82|nr:4'-phosphopantetheinyl transferase superfamily protein [Pseudomonas sp. RIT-PI-S]
MTTHTFHPACCTPLDWHCPLPLPVAGSLFASCSFQPSRLAPEDFPGTGIAKPASIERSVAKRQAEFLAGRLCARSVLSRLGLPECEVPIGEDRAPVWPAGIRGAITHSDGWAAAIAAPAHAQRGLGLDAETLLAPDRALRLAGEILTPAELERLPADPERAALAVTLTFSLKESLFKALYPLVLQRFYFEAAELLEWSCEGQARLRLLTDLGAGWKSGTTLAGQFTVLEGHLLSLVSVPA